jgi:phosphatidylserine/phosphatidylglycerophosphate/cardiolipin synthase-like enzyme
MEGPDAARQTAVADGRWARVGSTNLNIASSLGNYELDVVAEDRQFAWLMEAMYVEDLANSTEVVLDSRHRVKAPRSEGASRTGEARAAPPPACFASPTRSAPPSPITACSSPSKAASCSWPPCCC